MTNTPNENPNLPRQITNPLIGIDNLVREMTDEEYAELLESGWTMEPQEPTEE